MDISHLLNSLNEAQRQAVSAAVGQQLVLAGAGSGKTRVLVHRIAWLVQVEQASPWSILSVTFTNKAAHEMRGRIEQLLGISPQGMWVGTFHGLAHRLLRRHLQGPLQVLQPGPCATVLRVGLLPMLQGLTLLGIQAAVPLQHQPIAGLLHHSGSNGALSGRCHEP